MCGARHLVCGYQPALEVSLLPRRGLLGDDLKSALQATDPDLAMSYEHLPGGTNCMHGHMGCPGSPRKASTGLRSRL